MMMTGTTTASQIDAPVASAPAQLTDDELAAVGAGAAPMGLPTGVISLGRWIAAALLK